MTQETYPYLATNVITGFTNDRPAWWLKYAQAEGFEPMTYPGAIPIDHVKELLCSWEPDITRILDEAEVIGAIQSGLTGDDLIRAIETTRLTTHKSVKRSNQVKGLFGPQRRPESSRIGLIGIEAATHLYGDWLVGTVEETVREDELAISSAGLLRDGAQAWVQIERPESAVGPNGIRFSPYVLYSTSLDGSWQSQVNQNHTMVVCDNTANVGRGQGVAFKHTSRSGSKLGAFRSVSAAIMQGESDFKVELDRMLSVSVDDSQFARFITSFVPINEDDTLGKKTRSERKRQEITELYKSDNRMMGTQGTEFGVMQAVSTWNQHMSQLRNGTGRNYSDTDLRAQRNYAQRMRGNDGSDNETVKVLESVL